MAAVVDRVGITPEIDVFTLPHSKMRQLIVDTTEEVCKGLIFREDCYF